MKKLNVPNVLTLLRVVLVPVFVAFTMYNIVDKPINYLVCAIIFALTAITDMLDGKIARKYNLITNFGKFMDALADKFMVYSAYIALIFLLEDKLMKELLAWLTVVIILRDLVINGIRMLAASGDGTVIAAQFSGKAKTMTQSLSVIVLLMEPFFAYYTHLSVFSLGVFSYIAMALTLVATVWSGIDYINSYRKFIDFN